MKSLKKILSIFAAFMMVVGLTAANVKAEGETSVPNGSGTITLQNYDTSATYTLYKIFDATYGNNNTAYYIDESKVNLLDGEDCPFATGTTVIDGKVSVTRKSGKSDEQITEWLKANYNKFDPITNITPVQNAAAATLTWNQVPFGYYLIQSTLGDDVQVTINPVNTEVTVKAKNTNGPNITNESKTIVDVNGRETTAKIGEKVDFKIEFEARNQVTTVTNGVANVRDINQYVIEDIPVGIELNNDFEITVKEGEKVTKLTENDGYTRDGNTFTIVWKDANGFKYTSPATVTMTYSGKLTSVEGTNTANISYNDEEPTPSVVTVKTANVNLIKRAGSVTGAELPGAEFKLQTEEGEEIPVRVADKNKEAEAGLDYVVAKDGETSVTITAGNVTIGGLKANTNYQLVETKAPEGYNLLDTPEEFRTTNVSTTVTVNVINNAGSTLPSTGGMGTTMIYIAGAILMVGAAIIFVTNKRMKHE